MGTQVEQLIHHLATADDMEALGGKFAKACPATARIYLQGQLGAGKTTWVRGFLRGMDYTGKVKSPTYTLVESYQLQGRLIHHLDLYRINDPVELETIGVRDYLDGTGICLVEWPEQGGSLIGEPDVMIQINILGQDREVTMRSATTAGQKMIKYI